MDKKRQSKLPRYEGAVGTYIFLAIFIALETIVLIAQAYFLARAITFLFQGSSLEGVALEISYFLGAFLLRHLFVYIETVIAEKYAYRTAKMLREQLLTSYLTSASSTLRNKGTGHLVTLAMEGVDDVKRYIEIIGVRMIKTVMMPIFVVVFIYSYDKTAAIILVVTVPVVILFMILLGYAAQRMADKQYDTYMKLSNHFIDSLKGLETLTYLGQSKKHAKKIDRVNESYRKATMKTLRLAFSSSFALDFFTSLSIAFVAVSLGLRLVDGEMVLLPALTILLLAPEYFAPIKQVGKDYHATLDGQLAMAEIDSLLHDAADQPLPESKAIRLSKESIISLEGITIEKDGQILLDHVERTVSHGFIGIVGASGAGKTTLIRLLAGMLKQTAGKIKIDGQAISLAENEAWLEELAYIPQHPYIFPLSLADNIRFYRPDASDQAVEEIVEKIGLQSFVRSLPAGIHEKIGEGGRILSGGQEQRVALARAFLSNKAVILLDEPTAHLDVETEYEIKQLIMTLFHQRFVFIATHRLHWMQDMDDILYIEKGDIAEQGTAATLLKQKGKYAKYVQWREVNDHE